MLLEAYLSSLVTEPTCDDLLNESSEKVVVIVPPALVIEGYALRLFEPMLSYIEKADRQ